MPASTATHLVNRTSASKKAAWTRPWSPCSPAAAAATHTSRIQFCIERSSAAFNCNCAICEQAPVTHVSENRADRMGRRLVLAHAR
eukprot:6411679-Heterocapsa_arctica.AAC.1